MSGPRSWLRCRLIGAVILLLGASAKGGENVWTSGGPPVGNIQSLAVDPEDVSRVFAGSSVGGVWISSDGGSSWLASGLSAHVWALSGGAGGFVYASSSGGGFYRSTDRGATWLTLNNLVVTHIEADPVTTGLVYFVVGPPAAPGPTIVSLFRSPDGGSTSTEVGHGLFLDVISLGISPINRSRLFVLTVDWSLFETRDAGLTWTLLGTPLRPRLVSSLVADPFAPDTVWAAGDDGVFKSTDGGRHFSATGAVATGASVRNIICDPRRPGTAYLATSRGVFATASNGSSWGPINSGLGDPSVQRVEMDSAGHALHAGTNTAEFDYAVLDIGCAPDATVACLQNGQFRIAVSWRAAVGGAASAAQVVPVASNSTGFWFFDPGNVELVVKVLDGRSVNGKFWVFYGSLSNVEFTLTVTDTQTNVVRTYFNPQGQLASVADTSAF